MQQTPNLAITDEEAYPGAADLELISENYRRAKGTYWTRRAWRTGRNTAGTLELSMLTAREKNQKPLRDYAQEHKAALAK